MKYPYSAALLTVMTMISTCVHANMTVYPMSVGLNDKGEGSIRIISKSTDVQFVKATIYRINNPASPKETEDAVSSGDASSLVVMPARFAVPAGSSKLVRLVNMEPTEKETMYRVKFEAVSAPEDENTAVVTTGVDSRLSVNLVWGVLVSIPPMVPRIQMALSPDRSTIMNEGTQRIKITSVGLCHKADKDKQCRWSDENKNVFPGGQFSLPQTTGYSRVVIKYNDWIKKTESNIKSFDFL